MVGYVLLSSKWGRSGRGWVRTFALGAERQKYDVDQSFDVSYYE